MRKFKSWLWVITHCPVEWFDEEEQKMCLGTMEWKHFFLAQLLRLRGETPPCKFVMPWNIRITD